MLSFFLTSSHQSGLSHKSTKALGESLSMLCKAEPCQCHVALLGQHPTSKCCRRVPEIRVWIQLLEVDLHTLKYLIPVSSVNWLLFTLGG